MIRTHSKVNGAPRQPVPINPRVDDFLKKYVSAALAAGLGMLALNDSAEAKVIYKSANIAINPNSVVPLDVNGDGKTDFNFKDISSITSFGGGGGALTIAPEIQANRIWGHTRSSAGWASALFAGKEVGPSPHFSAGSRVMAISGSTQGVRRELTSGPWINVTNRYLGLKFRIKGKMHYGWARLNVSAANDSVSGTITGYAYESVPGKLIRTGQKKGAENAERGRTGQATLGQLARGSVK